MDIKSAFTPRDVDAVLQSREGRELLQILQKGGHSGLSQAAEAMKTGEYSKAVSILKPLLETPDSKVLLQELNRKLGRN